MNPSKKRAILLWGLAGGPIVFGTLQSIGAMTETYINEWFIFSQIGALLNSVADTPELIHEAGWAFVESEALVFVLFFLITGAYLSFGTTLYSKSPLSSQQRERIQIASIGLSGFLYAVLFYYAFSSVFTLDVSLLQRVAFGTIPILVVLALIAAWKIGPSVADDWGPDIKDELEKKRRNFERGFDSRLEDPLNKLDDLPFDRSIILRIREERGDFQDRCDELGAEIETVQSNIEDGEVSVSEAEQVANKVATLDPEQRLDELTEELRGELRSFYTERYDEFWTNITSSYEERYGESVVNINRYTTIVLPPAATDYVDKKLDIKNVDVVHDELIRTSVPIGVAVDALTTLERHIYGDDGLVNHIDSREKEVEELDRRLEKTIADLRREIDQFGGELRVSLKRIYRGGLNDTVFGEIEDNRVEALDLLHDCLFDEAIDKLESALEDISKCEEAVSSLSLAVSVAKDGRPYVDMELTDGGLGPVIGSGKLKSLNRAFEKETGRSFKINEALDRLEFEEASHVSPSGSNVDNDSPNSGKSGRSSTQSTTEGTPSTSISSSSTTGTQSKTIDKEEIEGDVLYHLKRLRSGISGNEDFVDVSSDGRATMQVEAIDDMYKHDEVYTELESFLTSQEIVDDHVVDVNGSKGHIELTTDPDTDPRRCTEQLVDKYNQKINS